jgi:two-component system, cell cycle sensor histidine kinase and response regulator CckA
MTDAVMPVMDGRRLADRIQATRPSTKCLFTSGYPTDFVGEHTLVDPTVVRYLQKPFSLEDLARQVRAALDQG